MKKLQDDTAISALRKNMQLLFLVFLLAYAVRAVYSYLDGVYRNFIPSRYARQILVIVFSSLFDLPSIGSILFMHHKNYSEGSIPDVVIDDEEEDDQRAYSFSEDDL